jgi:hypothetical protein
VGLQQPEDLRLRNIGTYDTGGVCHTVWLWGFEKTELSLHFPPHIFRVT